MRCGILGPLEVWDEGVELSIGGPKLRALLALLLLHPNEVVPADRLIDDLWGEDSPERAAAALRVNVSRLRKALPPDVLATRSPGYVIRLEPGDLDLHRFERLVDEARGLLDRGLPADASERLREALSLWRGPALADFTYESFAQAAIARLEEVQAARRSSSGSTPTSPLGRHDELVGRARGARRRAAAPRAPARIPDDGAVPVGSAGGGPRGLPEPRAGPWSTSSGSSRAPTLQELERAILRQEPALSSLRATMRGRRRGARSGRSSSRSRTRRAPTRCSALAEPLVRDPPRVVVLARLVPDAAELGSASAWLEERRSALEARGDRGASGLVHVDGAGAGSGSARRRARRRAPARRRPRRAPGGGSSRRAASAPCLRRRPATWLCSRPVRCAPAGPVLVPFGGAEHDWAAVELGGVVRPRCRRAAPARGRRRRAGAGQARREPPALARRARRPAGRWASQPSRC